MIIVPPGKFDWLWSAAGIVAVMAILIIPIYLAATYVPPKCLAYRHETVRVMAHCNAFNPGSAFVGGMLFGGWGAVAGGLAGAGDCTPEHDETKRFCEKWEGR